MVVFFLCPQWWKGHESFLEYLFKKKFFFNVYLREREREREGEGEGEEKEIQSEAGSRL